MSKGKILVIDDSPLVRRLLEVSLQEAGYYVQTAENGEEGLRLVEDTKPDLILLNFIMPKMTGSQFCSALKENENLKDIPIFLITGKGENVGKSFIEKYGVKGYFLKPFKTEDIIEKINSLIVESIPEEKEKIETEIFQTVNFQAEKKIDEKILESFEPEIKLSVEEEIQLPTLEEIILEEKPKEKTFEIPMEEEIILPLQETPEKLLEEIIEQPSKKEDVGLLLPEGLDIETTSIIEEPVEEEIKISPESVETSQFIEPQKIIERTIEEEKIYTPTLDEFEKIMEKRLEDFSPKISALIIYSIENSLKKFGLIKESNVILSGKTSYFDLNELLRMLCRLNISGSLYIFGENNIFEFLFIEGKIVYGITNIHKANIGNKLLRDFNYEEIKKFTAESISLLLNSKTDNFILEDLKERQTYLENLPRYDIEELF